MELCLPCLADVFGVLEAFTPWMDRGGLVDCYLGTSWFCLVGVDLSLAFVTTQQSIGKVRYNLVRWLSFFPSIADVLMVSLRLLSQLGWIAVGSVDCYLSL